MEQTNNGKYGARRRSFLSRWACFKKSQDGTAAIEFSFVAIPFLMIIFGTAEIAYNYTANRMLNASVDAVSRQLKTGQIQSGNTNEAQFRQILCNYKLMFMFDCGTLFIDVQEVDVFEDRPPEFDEEGNLDSSNFGFEPGGRQTINIVRVFAKWPTFLNWTAFGVDAWSGGDRLIMATSAFMTEPYTQVGPAGAGS
ncbi:MAG: TadE/TadG family type IV pilus assembly protein [Pseudomonadota bacterium]